jgi:phosphoribosylanthranilate isomerase
MTRIKICGLSRPEDVEAVNAALPDFVGFVFAPSRRQVTLEQARRLSSGLDARIIPVGVFVDAPLEQIIEAVKSGAIHTVQMHGSEDRAAIAEMKHCLPDTPLIKAYHVVEGADYLLLDNKIPGSGRPLACSSGELHAKLAASTLPVFLAGGITLETIEQALALNPWALDISSGAETDGVKDAAKIAALVQRVREWGRETSRTCSHDSTSSLCPAHRCPTHPT